MNPYIPCIATVILALASTSVGQIAAAPPTGPMGTVRIHVTNGYGDEVEPASIKTTITSRSGADFSPRQFDGTVRLPFGSYSLTVIVPGFAPWTGELNINSRQMRLTIGMPLGGLEGPKPTCALSGQVIGIGSKQAWIRIMPLFANEILEADVSKDGRFQLDGAECGDYILAVISGEKVLRSQYVRLKHAPNTVSLSVDAEH